MTKPVTTIREPRLAVHIYRLVGHAAEPLWVVQITRRRIAPGHSALAGEMACFVTVGHRLTTAPHDRRYVVASRLRKANLLQLPEWALDTWVRHKAITRAEARSLRAEIRATLAEAHKRRNITTCVPTRAHGFTPYASIGKGRLTAEHLRQIR